jgi:hypothetical protein
MKIKHNHYPNGTETRLVSNELTISTVLCACGVTMTRQMAPINAKYNWENWQVKE